MSSNEVYWFWSEKVWLPSNITWDDFKSEENLRIPQPSELYITIPIAILLFIIRLLYERFIGRPIARRYFLKETKGPIPAPNPILEAIYKSAPSKHTRPRASVLAKAITRLGGELSSREIERWWRRRKLQDNLSNSQKFCETSWRFLFYISIFTYGCFALYDKSWIWDTRECWVNYPRQDFYEMIVHHLATIMLIIFSWSNNMIRLGSSVLLLHDSVDFWLEGAKIAKYLSYQKLCDILFVLFAILWFITRICIYPSRLLFTSLNEGHHMLGGTYPVYYIFNSMMITLQILHIIWFYYICKMIYSFVIKGKVEKDGRSDTDCSSAEDAKKKE